MPTTSQKAPDTPRWFWEDLIPGLTMTQQHGDAPDVRWLLLNSSSLGSPGLDSLKWLKPVMVGDEIRAVMTVLANRPMKSKAHVGLTQSRWEGINQRGEVVLLLESWAMFGRRHSAIAEPGKLE